MKKSNGGKSKWSAHARPDGSFDFQTLSDREKEAFYKECERIGPEDGEPLTPVQRRLHARARRRGRPRKGQGSQIVSLSIEKALLRRAQRLAKAQGLSRSELFSRGLQAVLAIAGAA
jgi:hypothetical protein